MSGTVLIGGVFVSIMKKPRAYRLRQCPTSTGFMQVWLDVEAFACETKDRHIVVSCNHDTYLHARNARALARRLLAMADWIEEARP